MLRTVILSVTHAPRGLRGAAYFTAPHCVDSLHRRSQLGVAPADEADAIEQWQQGTRRACTLEPVGVPLRRVVIL